MSNGLNGKGIEDVKAIQVSLMFDEKNGVVIPLTQFQALKVVQLLGISIDKEKGTLAWYTDKQLDKILRGEVS